MKVAFQSEIGLFDATQKELFEEIKKEVDNARYTQSGIIIDLQESEIWELRQKLINTLGFNICVHYNVE